MRDVNGAPGVTRTPGTQFRKLLLYPPELRGRVGLSRASEARCPAPDLILALRAHLCAQRAGRGRPRPPLLGGRGDHFVPVGPGGATVSGRHWYSTTVPLAFAALLASGVKAWLTATVRAALHHRSASYVCRRCHSPPQTWLLISHGRAHRTHAPSAEADVADASNQQSTAPTMAAIITG